MPLLRAARGCGGLVVRIVLVAMLAVAALVCVANRSWIEGKALDAVYQGRPKIHAGGHFAPGAGADEDGVRQTAVLIHGKQSVRVTSPTERWRRRHKDAVCDHGVCTAAATREKFLGAGGVDIMGILGGLLVCYIVWVLLVDPGGPGPGSGYADRYDRGGPGRRYDRDRRDRYDH
ncbi:hypothetical protein [Actinomadura violacea]|uniref:Uncharacterized protein n=1 Tax=Actinomadura violacea TaxID=2819934 RepID=A0ABS3S8K0_9ACTN|nr:hypothetical protein [Actinomadura violacea]MBO2465330.1 hypothetical protein [Actinomadura violacea]